MSVLNNQLYFRLNEIPDLSLNKYQSLSSSGVDGILEKHIAFLRQWHRVAMLGNLSIHLLISYEPERPSSQKLEIGFLINSLSGESTYFEKAVKVLQASPLSEFYSLSPYEAKDVPCQPEGRSYRHVSTLYKKERFLTPTAGENNPPFFYVVPKWEMAEKARLYNMLKLMQSLDSSCLYRVDLFPRELSEEMNEKFSKPLTWLRNRAGNITNAISLTGERHNVPRDPNVDETLKQYEEWLKALDTSPTFYANISVFSNDEKISQILLDSAAAESIKKGYDSIKTEQGSFDALSFVSKWREDLCSPRAPETLKLWPITFTLEEVAPFFTFPALFDGEFIEIPKETAPKFIDKGLYIGKDKNGYDVNISIDRFAKHMFVCGVPGSGKTNTMLHLASTLWKEHRIPFLVLEPAKQEYRELSRFDIPELVIFSPSANTKFPLALNPFEFPKGLTLSEHIGKLIEVFEGSFPLQPPMPFLLDRAIESIYRAKGWRTNDINRGEKTYPTVSELYRQLEQELETTNYDGEIKGNIRSALEMRIGSLLRREMADIFDVKKSTIDPEDWLNKPIIIELEAMGEGPANFTTLLLCTLIRETLKAKSKDKDFTVNGVRHVIFIEEAHNLIAPTAQNETGDNANPKIAATAYIVKMLAEVRALHEGIIIADQLPTAMAPEVIKNTNIKLVHRLTSGDDRGLIGSTMSANDLQLESVASYSSGQALFTYEGMLRPFEMRVHYQAGHDQAAPTDEELYEIMKSAEGYRTTMTNYMNSYLKVINGDIEEYKNDVLQMAVEVSMCKYNSDTMVRDVEKFIAYKRRVDGAADGLTAQINRVCSINMYADMAETEKALQRIAMIRELFSQRFAGFQELCMMHLKELQRAIY